MAAGSWCSQHKVLGQDCRQRTARNDRLYRETNQVWPRRGCNLKTSAFQSSVVWWYGRCCHETCRSRRTPRSSGHLFCSILRGSGFKSQSQDGSPDGFCGISLLRLGKFRDGASQQAKTASFQIPSSSLFTNHSITWWTFNLKLLRMSLNEHKEGIKDPQTGRYTGH